MIFRPYVAPPEPGEPPSVASREDPWDTGEDPLDTGVDPSDTGEDPPSEIREEYFLPSDHKAAICHLTHDQLLILWHQRMRHMHYKSSSPVTLAPARRVLRPRDLHRITALLSLPGEDMPFSAYSDAVAAFADGMDFVNGMDYVIQRLQTEDMIYEERILKCFTRRNLTAFMKQHDSHHVSIALHRAKGIL